MDFNESDGAAPSSPVPGGTDRGDCGKLPAHDRSLRLAEFADRLDESIDRSITLEHIARMLVPTLGDACVVDVIDEGGCVRQAAEALVDRDQEASLRSQRTTRVCALDSDAPTASVLRTGESILIPKVTEAMLASTDAGVSGACWCVPGACSVMIAALTARGRRLGVIGCATMHAERVLGVDDLALLEQFARRAAIALDNARLFHAEQVARAAAERRAERIARLQTVADALGETRTPDELASLIVDQAASAMSACCGTLALLDEAQTHLEMVASQGLSRDASAATERAPLDAATLAAEVVRRGEPMFIGSPGEGPVAVPPDSRACACVPIRLQGRVAGALSLLFREPRVFDDDDRAFVLTLARQYERAIERAGVFRDAQSARDESEHAGQLKDQFLATLSHELRTPLNAVLGWVRMLRLGSVAPDRQQRVLETIERNAYAQAQLIEELLDVSRIASGKLRLHVTHFEVDREIEAAIDAIRPAAVDKGVSLHFVRPSPSQSIVGDPDRIQQVVWNLLSNSVKFTGRGGAVDVAVSPTPSGVEITVSDTGEGIDAAFLPHVFERFRQAESMSTHRQEGLGLGLSIVKEVVDLHGGTVHALSPGLGGGATFVVRLPRESMTS